MICLSILNKVDDSLDPEWLSIYRVSIRPYTEESVMRRIFKIRTSGYNIDSNSGFTGHNEITFIKANLKVFDNSQININQMFIVWAPYTVFLWCGENVQFDVIKGAISVFREFLYKIRKVPIKFLPSYLDDEKNFGYPKFQIIFRGNEDSRFRNLFKRWKETRYDFLMMRTNPQYKFNKFTAVNNPQYLSISGLMFWQEDSESTDCTSDFNDDNSDTEYLRVLRDSTLTTKKMKQKKISAFVNVDLSESQMKQYLLNMEFELTYFQGVVIKSMNIKYWPQNIFKHLPGDEVLSGNKIPLSSIFQYEIQGTKFSKAKYGINKGIFERNTSYIIVVHKSVIHGIGNKKIVILVNLK